MLLKRRGKMLGWVAAGQALSAAGTVVGLRILTQFLDPGLFGAVTLALGAAALALGLSCTPLTQAAMYFYPSLAARGESAILAAAMRRGLLRALPWLFAGGLVAGTLYMVAGHGSIWVVLGTLVLLFCDCWRSVNLVLLNAAADHRRYGTWMALEAWGRPLAATAALLVFRQSAALVLFSYAAVSALLAAVLARPPDKFAMPEPERRAFDRRMWQYGLPLIPLGLLGWANGLSDRYIIGGLLSLHDTGIYAAAYGLASRPLLLVNATFEQFMRPSYQNAVSAGNLERATLILRYWLAGLAGTCSLVVVIVFLWREQLAAVFLGPSFRSGAVLMPWIAAGYGILTLSYVFERVCLAHGHTRRVLAAELVSGVAALVTTVTGVHFWGLIGAAVSVPCYFGIQLCTAFILSQHSQRVYQYRPT